MTGFLIPIKEFSPPVLAAVRFAIEFGKRSKAKLHFLFVNDPVQDGNPLSDESGSHRARDAKLIHETIEALITCGRDHDGLQTEIYHRNGDYIQEERLFIKILDDLKIPIKKGVLAELRIVNSSSPSVVTQTILAGARGNEIRQRGILGNDY